MNTAEDFSNINLYTSGVAYAYKFAHVEICVTSIQCKLDRLHTYIRTCICIAFGSGRSTVPGIHC